MRLRRNTQVGATLLLFFLVTVGLLGDGCNETPLEPENNSPKDYRVWFWDAVNDEKLFWFHTSTGEVDSVSLPWAISDNPTVSHDGTRIYVPSGKIVKVLETDSFTSVGEILHYSETWIVVSPNGQYLALFGDSTWIVRTSDYSTIFADSGQSHNGGFSKDGQTLYTAGGTLRRISLANPEQIVVDTLRGSMGFSQVKPTPDETRLAVYFGLAPYVWAFGIYDIALDSILNYDPQSPGQGRIAMTPDGKLAFYGNPGNIMPGPIPTSDLSVYDVEATRLLKRMNMTGLIEDLYPPEFYIGELVVSPDGRWLIGNRGFTNMGFNIFLWNIQEERIERFWTGPGKGVLGLSIQQVE